MIMNILQQKLPELQKIKSNPHHFPIIDKWNSRLAGKYSVRIFNVLEENITGMVTEKIDDAFDDFADVKNLI